MLVGPTLAPARINPAPGYRDYGRPGYEGVPREVGRYGYSWSSIGSGTSGLNLGFNVTWLGPSRSDYRGHGFQLRCLSE